MFYIYILYSPGADKFYVGYTNDVTRRLQEHNHQDRFNTFTSKFRPWELAAVFECSSNEAEAMRIERFIKKQKSRNFILQLTNPHFVPSGSIAQLVRVPQLRD